MMIARLDTQLKNKLITLMGEFFYAACVHGALNLLEVQWLVSYYRLGKDCFKK